MTTPQDRPSGGFTRVQREEAQRRDIIESFESLFSIERELGSGGVSHVFLARDRRRDRDVALKVLRPELAVSIQAERFLREVDITRSLRHPNILPLYDAGNVRSRANPDRDHMYFTAPFVNGQTLDHRLRRDGKLPIADAIRIATALADALQYAHDQGVLHRDVKPSNVFLAADGQVLLADFGVARAMRGDSTVITITGVVVGTPAFMSPEQASGATRMDGRSDQYSLACLVYQTLSGAAPFASYDAHETFIRHMTERPPSMRSVRDTVPQHVDDAVLKALEKTPADRFERIADFGKALQLDSGVTRPPMWGPLPRAIDERSCFVIMPFGEHDDLQEAYRDHIAPAVESCGLTASRADDIFSHREVTRDIWAAIGRARVIIADVTGRNPNVFYELGMAHAIGKDVIIITQRKEDIPFDVTHIRHIKYEYTPRGVVKLRDALTGTINALLNEQG